MTNVSVLPHEDQPPELGDGIALRRCARYAMWLLTMILGMTVVFTGVVLALGLLCQGRFLLLGPNAAFIESRPEGSAGIVPFGGLPWPTRLSYAANFMMTQAPILLLLTDLRAFLRDLAAGTLFAAGHASRLRRMAVWLLAYAIAPIIGQILVRSVGQGVDLAWFRTSSLHALVLAALLIVLAELIRVGQAIKDDRDGFV